MHQNVPDCLISGRSFAETRRNRNDESVRHVSHCWSSPRAWQWYQPKRILPPLSEDIESRSTWTAEGAKYLALCKAKRIKGEYKPGTHYVATPAKGRVLLADLPGLRGLSHRLVDLDRAIRSLASFPLLITGCFCNLVVSVQVILHAAF